MAQPVLITIPLDQLRISKLNMRHSRKTPDVSDILPSIRESGIQQTLLVRKEGQAYGVIAGRRCFFALTQIAKETGETPLVPCAIMSEADTATALEASVIENIGRLPASEMEQYTAFKRLHEDGRRVTDIASYFGVTDLQVKRTLALASLADPIRKLYSDEEIDRETIRALTLATPEQQAEWLRLYSDPNAREPRGRNCKAWVSGGAVITTDKALFDIERYDGDITTDLFGEHGVFTDPDTFWRAQSAAIANRIEAYRAEGWSDVVCLDRGAYFHCWDHQVSDKSEGGKVFVECRQDGEIILHEGYLTLADARRMARAGACGEDGDIAPVKPEMSGPLAEYILLHRQAAAAASLSGQPQIALRLMVAHAVVGSALWDVRPHECRSKKAETRASLESSKTGRELDQKHKVITDLFKARGINFDRRRNGDAYRLCELFAALLSMSDRETMSILAFVMADTLEAGGALVEAVLHVCDTDLPDYWSPDPAFFELLRDKRAINAMVADIGSLSLAQSSATDTAKTQKSIIRDRIKGQSCAPNSGWRPGWMHVPAKRLVDGASSPPIDAWARVSALFGGDKATPRHPDTIQNHTA